MVLVQPNEAYKTQYLNFVNECGADVVKCGMGYCIQLSDEKSFANDIERLKNYEKGIGLQDGWVSSSIFWLMDENHDRVYGVITIRHTLTRYLLYRGGHISYYIRPAERRKGYATCMLRLALEKCKELRLDKVMITCAKHNTGSAKTILNNGGILHSEDNENGEQFQRYWINIF